MKTVAEFFAVSNGQYSADGGKDGEVILPRRATEGSAGYDFFAPTDVTVPKGGKVKVATGIRCRIDNGWVLAIFPKSGLGCKYRVGLCNTVGIIDSDYFGAQNEGHIILWLCNDGEQDVVISRGQGIAQGIFLPFALAAEETVEAKRKGGFGSTEQKHSGTN